MNIQEAFRHQIDHTRLITEQDLASETDGPIVWNGVIIRPDGNHYSSGQEMQVGQQLLVGYVVSRLWAEKHSTPKPILLEASEIDSYEKILTVVRVVDHVPVLTHKDPTSSSSTC